MTTTHAPTATVQIDAGLLAALIERAAHITVRVDPIDLARAGQATDGRVIWPCRSDCPVCWAQARLEEATAG
ncbi:hypothetical protein ACFFMN_22855 [Planobispora siamensis]|uniref:Uncharacterized protein n=1 Tax=Planobispora siamensis TaxID=936338 RepID=A0A8J3SJF5_9ACTN|nr:hypothetical protein [Planobispora siamensis]GIH95407.1 hypothetical protein Psi01_60370 [Planobispora siamensis]